MRMLSRTALALLRQKLSVFTNGSICAGVALAKSFGVGNFLNSAGVALFTPTSVL